MPAGNHREAIRDALQALSQPAFGESARSLLNVLGYESEKTVPLADALPATFLETFDPQTKFNRENGLLAEWKSAELLFQLTQEEVAQRWQGALSFSVGRFENTLIESYLFVAIELRGSQYTRTKLAAIAREVNKLFPMPVMVFFRYGSLVTVAVIDREINRRDSSRDVLRKVTLIKDISTQDPLRAHIDILHDLSFESLYEDFRFQTFVALHQAWRKRLDSSDLNKRFYQDIANWYFWAQKHPTVRLPKDVDASSDEQRSIFFIRLLTRLIFCWFLQEKGLVPRKLFRWEHARDLLKDAAPQQGSYYQAILQNLFFATLNREPEKRGFRDKKTTGRYDQNRGITTLYRYQDLLAKPHSLLEQFAKVPFVNGGLFDCLDDVRTKREAEETIRLDGFSDNPKETVLLPNLLFFGAEQHADLSEEFQDSRRSNVTVRPLMETLSRYKFTVEENTPLEQEIALDPELLGKVFENLLASYNDDTRTVARKKLGAFYTPREVVRYMVDEALMLHYSRTVPEEKIRALLSDEAGNPCDESETNSLIRAIDETRVLDPACGSGAFPMGALQRLVYLLGKLDPNNVRWKRRQLETARKDLENAQKMEDLEIREAAIASAEFRIQDIERSFDESHHDLDYGRKLYLIENSIFGVDIQPIACQIAKLRFFVALLVDQKSELQIRPLPNLETRIVAANALIPSEKATQYQQVLGADQIRKLRAELQQVRHDHFNARRPEEKRRHRIRDAELRSDLATELERQGMPNTSARMLAAWDPYDQNAHADFFEPTWMFSLDEEDFQGFDVVIGNPPYVRQEKIRDLKPALREHFECFSGVADLYVYFYERGVDLLADGGVFSFITSNKWLRSGYGGKLRAYLRTKTKVHRLIDFGDADIFDAIAYPMIIVLTKEAPGTASQFHALNWNPEWKVEEVSRHLTGDTFRMAQSDLAPEAWRMESKAKLKLLERIKAAGVPLGEYVNGRFYRGILTGLNEAFVIDRATRDQLIAEHPSSEQILKPFLRGRDVKRWRVEPQDLWLIFTRRGIDIPKFPAVLRHLQSFRQQLEPMPRNWDRDGGNSWPGRKPGSYEWYEIQDNIAYWEEFEQPKLVVPAIAESVSFAIDRGGHYSNNKSTIFLPDDIYFVCGIVNSQVSNWFARQTFATKQGGFFDFEPRYSTQLLIPKVSRGHQRLISVISEYISEFDGQGPIASYYERLLNALVYEVFFEAKLHEKRLLFFSYLEESRPPALAQGGPLQNKLRIEEHFALISDLNHA
ncbi:MAG: Eco57I restriction-modification methylase domain-containing protein, partial [Bryobacterales bacterium]|nr:Eco57I restriction-modification methylase domain-containing protein [Bryobacterales bacterium]